MKTLLKLSEPLSDSHAMFRLMHTARSLIIRPSPVVEPSIISHSPGPAQHMDITRKARERLISSKLKCNPRNISWGQSLYPSQGPVNPVWQQLMTQSMCGCSIWLWRSHWLYFSGNTCPMNGNFFCACLVTLQCDLRWFGGQALLFIWHHSTFSVVLSI